MNNAETPITEVALLEIKTGQEVDFESAYTQAKEIISQADGYLSHTLQRCIETPTRYLLLVQWTSVEAHTVGFRQSDLFTRWSSLIGPYFDKTPVVAHYKNL